MLLFLVIQVNSSKSVQAAELAFVGFIFKGQNSCIGFYNKCYIMAEDLPFKAEYAKSGRANCKGCKTPIPQGSVRLAAMVQVCLSYLFSISYLV